jgi:hypothetical protein
MANCPKCQSEMDDRTCPPCRGDVASTETAPEGKFKFQFDLQFLFFLMTLTAVVCAISKIVGNWAPAPLIAVAALMLWRMRQRAKRRCLTGMGIGFVSGMLLFAHPIPHHNPPKVDVVVFIGALFAAIGAGASAMGRKDHHVSGVVAMGFVAIYLVALNAISRGSWSYAESGVVAILVAVVAYSARRVCHIVRY